MQAPLASPSSSPPGRATSPRARLVAGRSRLLLPRFCGNRLGDLPEVAFGIGKMREAEPPGLVGWGLDKWYALRSQILVRGVDIRRAHGKIPAWRACAR